MAYEAYGFEFAAIPLNCTVPGSALNGLQYWKSIKVYDAASEVLYSIFPGTIVAIRGEDPADVVGRARNLKLKSNR